MDRITRHLPAACCPGVALNLFERLPAKDRHELKLGTAPFSSERRASLA
jgi:hypothetical protein